MIKLTFILFMLVACALAGLKKKEFFCLEHVILLPALNHIYDIISIIIFKSFIFFFIRHFRFCNMKIFLINSMILLLNSYRLDESDLIYLTKTVKLSKCLEAF